MSALDILKASVGNYFQATNSVLAGGAASMLIYAVGAVLVASGVSLPVIGVPTMAMVGAVAVVGGHIITSMVPDSVNQNIKALAGKLDSTAEEIRAVLPQAEENFPGDAKPSGTVTNLKLKT